MFAMSRKSQFLGGVLLVVGTTIGAAMLALPVTAGICGFFPSVILFTICWLYMVTTAFLFLELNFAFEGDIDLISIAKETLGKVGQGFCWVLYLFLLYSLTTAYIAGSVPIFDHAFAQVGVNLPGWACPLPLVLIFGAFVYKGVHSVDSINRVLMGGLAITFSLIVGFLFVEVDPALWMHQNWNAVPLAFPVIATSFGFHIIIPTLTTYLGHELRLLKKVIWVGSLIPLLVYIIWEALALGIIPLGGDGGIIAGYAAGLSGADLLAMNLNASWVGVVVRLLSFFAIVTSFLGVSLSLRHFLADGLGIQRNRLGRLLLVLLTFVPPLVITYIDPRAFLTGLEYAGAYGVVVLLGMMPAVMVWTLRSKKETLFRVPGGKGVLIAVILLSLIIIGTQCARQMGLFQI